MQKRKIIKPLIICLVVSLLLEIGIFNYPHWESRTFGENKELSPEYGEGLKRIGGNRFEVIDPEAAYITFDGIDVHVDNLFIDAVAVDGGVLDIELAITDVAHENYWRLPQTEVVPTVEGTKYVRLHLAGESDSIRLKIVEEAGSTFSIDAYSVNQVKPFDFSRIRLACAFIVLALLALFRPSSWVYSQKLDWSRGLQKALIVSIIVFQLGCLFAVNQVTDPRSYATESGWQADDQYNDLADALLSGNVVLDKEVPEFILELDNPYDLTARSVFLRETGQEALANEFTDYAYYDGAFYSYFGVVPALLLFCPYKAVLGADLPTWVAVYTFGALLCIGICVLLYQLIRKILRADASLGLYLLMCLVVTFTCGLLYLEFMPTVYSVPIVSGLCFVVWGLVCWLMAKKPQGGIDKRFLVLGSLCMALSLGCRPPYILCAMLAFPLFWEEIKTDRIFFSRKGLANTLCVITPFLIIGALAMYYNYIRFDSLFDFGANYNLTGNDMTHRGFEPARFPLGLYVYFFQPGTFTMDFPFMTTVPAVPDYQGQTSMEPLFGGFFFVCPLALAALATLSGKIGFSKHARMVQLSFLVLGLVIVLFVIQASGLTARYLSDFALFFLIPMALVLFWFENKISDKGLMHIFRIVIGCTAALSIGIHFWQLLIEDRYASLIIGGYNLVYTIKDSLSFLW